MKERLIRRMEAGELEQATALIWRVFCEFEAPEYAPEGVAEFRRYIALPSMRELLEQGLRLWGCFEGAALLGVLAMRPPAHVTLLFVDKQWHRQGVARSLWEHAKPGYRDCYTVTVNASPYAREAYRRMGFHETAEERTVNGIRFIPMEYRLEEE